LAEPFGVGMGHGSDLEKKKALTFEAMVSASVSPSRLPICPTHSYD
jgi:hypothetical protein